MSAEGWYRDPFGEHEDRWFSAGTPTRLVRDAGVESHDEPPSSEYSGPLTEAVHRAVFGGADLQRADDAERGGEHDSREAIERIDDAFIQPNA